MTMNSIKPISNEPRHGLSRRAALGLGGAALAAFAVSDLVATAAMPTAPFPPEAPRPEKGLRVATCQFPVSGSVTLMLHSLHNARSKGENCLDVLNVRQVPTRCADNRLWAVANNSSQPYSHWGSFVARPDATLAQQLPINQAGMLVHDFPDGLSKGGWYHNERPLRLRDDELMTWGQPSQHPRQLDSRAEP